MQDGLVVERGTHQQLMDLGGLYSQLVAAQVSERSEEVEHSQLDSSASG